MEKFFKSLFIVSIALQTLPSQSAEIPPILAPANAHGGGHGSEGGHGAGLIRREGDVLTFTSSELRIGVTPLEIDEIPGLSEVISKVKTLGFHEDRKQRMLEALTPTTERLYFRIDEEQLSQQKRDELIAVYQKLYNADEEISIGGLTVGKETYLLPDFFALKSIPRWGGILQHEAAWVLDDKADYRKVLQAESAMENYLAKNKSGYDTALFDSLDYLLGGFGLDGLLAAADYDKRVNAKEYTMLDLFGKEALDTMATAFFRDLFDATSDRDLRVNLQNKGQYGDLFRTYWNTFLLEQISMCPQLKLYHELYRIRDKIDFRFIITQQGALGGKDNYRYIGQIPVDVVGTYQLDLMNSEKLKVNLEKVATQKFSFRRLPADSHFSTTLIQTEWSQGYREIALDTYVATIESEVKEASAASNDRYVYTYKKKSLDMGFRIELREPEKKN